MDHLLDVLREYAASSEKDSAVDPRRDWHWDVNSIATRLAAYTKEVSPDPESAWRNAVKLHDAILALGYELRSESQLGGFSEETPRYDDPIEGWRGYVELVIATK